MAVPEPLDDDSEPLLEEAVEEDDDELLPDPLVEDTLRIVSIRYH